MDAAPAQPSPASGINLYGYLTSNVGLGVVARNTLRMLLATETPVAPLDVELPGSGADRNFAALIAENHGRAPYGVNLFHMNPDRVRLKISPFDRTIDFAGRANAIVPFWEAPRLPRSWLAPLSAMDVVLAPTRFVADAVRADLPQATVVHYPQTVFLPDGVAADRARFGLPEDAVVFVASFAVASDIERKNPWGAIEAFRRAFAGRDDAVLALKVSGQGPALQRLRTLAAQTPGVRLIDEPLGYADVLSLYASADVLLSLHRSEGLGLNMLEAMALGVPVLATGWSGNLDFTSEETAALVGFRLVDIEVPRTSPYHPDAMGITTQWAEPDLDDAARWMRRLADEPQLRVRLGEAGRVAAAERQARYLEGGMVDDLAAALAGWAPNRPQRVQIARLERSFATDYAAWAARAVGRRIRAKVVRHAD